MRRRPDHDGGVANAGLVMQQYFRDVLPIPFSYSLNNGYQ